MHQIELPDQLYLEAQRRATAAGFESVDEYVANVITHDIDLEQVDYDYLFTPERLAIIDGAAAQIEAGLSFSSEEVAKHFERKRNEWRQNPAV